MPRALPQPPEHGVYKGAVVCPPPDRRRLLEPRGRRGGDRRSPPRSHRPGGDARPRMQSVHRASARWLGSLRDPKAPHLGGLLPPRRRPGSASDSERFRSPEPSPATAGKGLRGGAASGASGQAAQRARSRRDGGAQAAGSAAGEHPPIALILACTYYRYVGDAITGFLGRENGKNTGHPIR